MKIITWEWRKQVMVDYFVFSWMLFSRHFEGRRYWSWQFHWKASNVWYHNFRRHVADRSHGFTNTRLTIRFGRRLMVIGGFDMKRYYRDVKVLEIKHGGKITYQYIPPLYQQPGQFKHVPEDVQKTVDDMKKGYEHLSKYYPNDSWRN